MHLLSWYPPLKYKKYILTPPSLCLYICFLLNHQSRLNESQWGDIEADRSTKQFFSLAGHEDDTTERRFYINHRWSQKGVKTPTTKESKECDEDVGWFVAVDIAKVCYIS